MGGAGSGPLGSIQVVKQSNQQQTNWAPRIGLAWTPGNTNGNPQRYGIAYDFNFLNPITNLRFAAPFMYSFTTNDFTGANSFANMVAGNFSVPAAWTVHCRHVRRHPQEFRKSLAGRPRLAKSSGPPMELHGGARG